MTQRRSYGEGFAFAILSVGCFALLGLASTYATARVYGVSVLGQIALSYAPTGAVWILSTVREQPAMIRILTRHEARDPAVTGIWTAVLTFSSVLTLVVSAGIALVTWFAFHGPVHHPELFAPAMVQLGGYVVFTNAGMNLDSVFAAYRSGRQLFWIRLHQIVLTLVLVVVGGLIWGTVMAYAFATVAAFVTSLVHRLIAVRRWMPLRARRTDYRAGFAALPEIVRFGLKMAPGFVADGASNQAGVWILGAISPTATVGAYNRAWSLGTRLVTLSDFVTEMTLPALVERRQTADDRGFDVTLADSVRYVLMLMLWPAAIVGGAALPIMRLMGPGFDEGADALSLLMLLPVLFTASSIQSMALAADGRPGVTSVVAIGRMLIVIPCSVLLIHAFHTTGAAVAILIGAFGETAVKFALTRSSLSGSWRRLWSWRERCALALAYVGGFALARFAGTIVPGDGLWLVLALVAGTAGYALALLCAGGVAPRDRERARRVVRRLSARGRDVALEA